MAKGIGLIGNFKGKVGNMVGYKLTDSNSGNTQGIRVYQPIVKNPKTAAQAEQRAKLAPINATYRALKMVIDRGNEGLPYGNKSRLAWLKQAFLSEQMPWIEKGKTVMNPVGCQISKGSLVPLKYTVSNDALNLLCLGATSESDVTTVGKVSTLLLAAYSSLKAGDQITIVAIDTTRAALSSEVYSFVINATSSEAIANVSATSNALVFSLSDSTGAGAVILSREGVNGEHLRSTASIVFESGVTEGAPYDSTSKAAAIESYMSSAAVNADWAEESIQ